MTRPSTRRGTTLDCNSGYCEAKAFTTESAEGVLEVLRARQFSLATVIGIGGGEVLAEPILELVSCLRMPLVTLEAQLLICVNRGC